MATGRKLLIAGLLTAVALPVLAQTPTPNSRPRQNAPAAAPAPPQQAAPAPFTNPFAALLGRTGPHANITPEQRAVIDKVGGYLSNVHNLSGKFVQVGPDGRRVEGDFYIQKPGKVRFEYDPPA